MKNNTREDVKEDTEEVEKVEMSTTDNVLAEFNFISHLMSWEEIFFLLFCVKLRFNLRQGGLL